jgi:hypothetical protein
MSLAQQALDLAVGVNTRVEQQDDIASKENIADLASAVQLLAQNALSATPSSDTPDPSDTSVDASTTTPVDDPSAGS